MEVIEKTLEYTTSLLRPNTCLLDIETTGLSKSHDAIICIGVLYADSQGLLCTKQWFGESLEEEKEILIAFLAWCTSYPSFYTYNGNSFDLPFIVSRLAFYDLDANFLKEHLFLDMKKTLRKLATKRSDLEACLEYKRETTLSGKELVSLYTVYHSTKLPQYKELILAHNKDELKSLWVFYEAYYRFNHLSKGIYTIEASPLDCFSVAIDYTSPFTSCLNIMLHEIGICWKKDETLLHLSFPLSTLTLRKYLSPAKDYFYVPSQNQLMHKSLAAFLPKELKQKVSKADCYLSKTSTFIKIYTHVKVPFPIWYNEQGEMFLEYSHSESENEDVQAFIETLIDQVTYLVTH